MNENSISVLLDSLNKFNLVSPEDLKEIQGINPQLLQAFVTQQIYRTDYEARFSVLNDTSFPTADAKYWQCLREQMVQLDQLIHLSFEYEKNQVKLERVEYEKEKEQRKQNIVSNFLVREKEIEIAQLKYSMAQQKRVAADRIREVLMWNGFIEELRPHLQYGTVDVSLHQPESYARRFQIEESIAKRAGTASLQELINLKTHLMMSEQVGHPLIDSNKRRAKELELKKTDELKKLLAQE